MGLRCKLSHQTGHWLLVLDWSNACNTVKRAVTLEEVAIRAVALTPFVTNVIEINPRISSPKYTRVN